MITDLFDDLFDFPFDDRRGSFMCSDIEESEKDYKIKIEVPAVKKEDIKLSLNNGYLTVSIEKKEDESSKNCKTLHNERYFGTFKRSYKVGNSVKDSDISASLNDGLLVISIDKPKPIDITSNTKYIEIN